MLTPKQHELLLFIHQKLKETGVSPSFDEMKTALDLRSKSGIHRLVTALEERGFVRRLPHRARALEILKMPEEAAAGPARRLWEKGFSPEVVEGGLGKTTQTEEAHEVPILGRIAAGTPIEAIQSESGRIPAPAHLLRGGEHFALEVQGESMIEAGILDGDCVIIQRCDDASSGEIVVALVDDQEATLKRLRKRGASIALEAANPDFETRIFGPDRVRIQGRLVGLMREY